MDQTLAFKKSAYSSINVLSSLVFPHKSGVKNLNDLDNAANKAFKRFPLVLVDPLEDV